MRNVRIEIEYDGSNYHGWQRQAGFNSIQQELEQAVEKVTGETVVIHGSGRTDTGVHALHQVAHFQTGSKLPDDKIFRALNSYLPEDISVLKVQTATAKFHARFDAVSKRYLYMLRSSKVEKPLSRRFTYWIPQAVDLGKMREGARHFLGAHDFASFAGVGKDPKDTKRTIYSFKIFQRKDLLLFFVEGDGFLMHMVRNMVGTLILVGRGKLAPQTIETILRAKDRKQAGPSAPAHGLYLLRVKYQSRHRKSKRRRD